MLEKDVETAFIKWINRQPYYRVIGRQVRLPLGKLDVLILVADADPSVVVAEIKLGVINEKACTQLLGYTTQVKHILECAFPGGIDTAPIENVRCTGFLVGSSINEMTNRVIQSMSMNFAKYTVKDGKFDFEFDQSFGEAMNNHRIAAPLMLAGRALHKTRVELKVHEAQALDDHERLYSAMYDHNQYPFEDIKRTVSYWQRPK